MWVKRSLRAARDRAAAPVPSRCRRCGHRTGVSRTQIRFDDVRGEPRNADLAIEARDRSGVVAITVEGKADESFDRPVGHILESAAGRIANDERTGAIARIEALSTALLPPWREGLPHLGALRYQLLTGIAGTVAWAREIGASRAIFIVHEFITNRTRDENHARNTADLNTFLSRFSDGAVTQLSAEGWPGRFRFLETRTCQEPCRSTSGKLRAEHASLPAYEHVEARLVASGGD